MVTARKNPRRAIRARANGTEHSALDGIRRLNRGLRVAARGVERSTGMSAAQLFVLAQLSATTAASIGDLAEWTHTDRSSVSVVVDRLASRGLVSREAAAGDRRRAAVRITRAGMRLLRRAPRAPTELLVRALKRMPPATLRSLDRALRLLNERLGFTDVAMLFED